MAFSQKNEQCFIYPQAPSAFRFLPDSLPRRVGWVDSTGHLAGALGTFSTHRFPAIYRARGRPHIWFSCPNRRPRRADPYRIDQGQLSAIGYLIDEGQLLAVTFLHNRGVLLDFRSYFDGRNARITVLNKRP